MAKTGKLTSLMVAKLKKPGHYGDGGLLYLQIDERGNKSWDLRYRVGGRVREMGLGSLDTFSLAEARERAREGRKLLADGNDPIEVRKAVRMQQRLDEAKAITFADFAKSFIATRQSGWRNSKHAAQWPSTLKTYVYPIFGALPVQAIDTGLVIKALEPIWQTKPETAGRVRGRIESILDGAAARGYRQGENPARWKGHLENLLPKKSKVRRVEHHAALPYVELPAFMAELREQDGIAARALEFAILTAARTGEVIGARWSEINLAERLWTIPAERMKKSDREHRVPLSEATIAVLERMKAVRQGAFVFPGGRVGRPLSNMSMLMTLRRMGCGDSTTHGFRSTFRDWAAERTGFAAEVAEMALAHTVSDKVEAAYRRGDLFQKRRQLTDAWARFCTVPATAGKVVSFAAAK